MAYVVITGSFPPHVSMEVGKKFLELEKLPDYIETEHVFNTAQGDYAFFTIYKIEDDSKYFDALKAITKRFSGYRDIVGYKYTVHPVLEAKDALSMVGLG